MKIYHYHPVTGEYLCEGFADKDPLVENGWLFPAHSTELPPPEVSENQAAVFAQNQWIIVPDYRGTVYWVSDRSEHKITDLGVELPESALLEKPKPTYEELLIQAKTIRALAYASTHTGSDRFFAEAARKRAAGDVQGAIAAEQEGLQRVLEIKEKYPLPEIGE